MHKRFFLIFKKKYLSILILLVGVALLTLVYVLVVQKDSSNVNDRASQEEMLPPPTTLAEAARREMYFNVPDDDYFNALENFALSTDNEREKARTYKTLGDDYYKVGKAKESLNAYTKSKELFDLSDFTDEEKNFIEETISIIDAQLKYAPDETIQTETQRGSPL